MTGLTLIETERLVLPSAPVEALEALVSGDHARAAAICGAAFPDGWPTDPDARAGLAHHLAAVRARAEEEPWRVRLIVERGERRVAGSIHIKGPPDGDGRVELGWGLEPDRRGRGLAREAVAAVVGWLRGQPAVTEIVARIRDASSTSVRLAIDVGFRSTDVVEDGQRRFVLDRAGRKRTAGQDAFEARWRAAAATPRIGLVRGVVVRTGGGEHATPERAELDPALGLAGDRWAHAEAPDPDAQISLIDLRVVSALVEGDPTRFHVPGDNLIVDLDLGEESLPVGTLLRAGGATLVISPKPHRGCGTFRRRLGDDALRFIGDRRHHSHRLRGVYARVLEGGPIALGDRIERLDPPR